MIYRSPGEYNTGSVLGSSSYSRARTGMFRTFQTVNNF